jgi:hypothetical protein
MKILEFKRSKIGIITEFRGIPNGFPNQGSGLAMMPGATVMKRVNGARLTLRIRIASEFDVTFMRLIQEFYDKDDVAKGVNATLRLVLMHARNATHLELAQLVTKIDENFLTTEALVRALMKSPP